MRIRSSAAIVIMLTFGLAGCGGSSSGDSPAVAPSSVNPSPSETAVALAGTESVDIQWSVQPEVDVACPTGLHGYCTHVRGSGSSDQLGVLNLDEYLATPKDGSCSTGAVKGTFTMTDAMSSAEHYAGVGHFCWKSLTGAFHLKLGKGSGQFHGATGTLVAKITNGTNLADEWSGTLHFAG